MSSGDATPPANGSTAGKIAYNLPEWMAMSAFLAIAWFSVVQLFIAIYMTFKRRRGLYFWSLVVSGLGVIFHSVGFLLKAFQIITNNYLTITIITIGWWPMVTGQALVLYSRLHLVVREQRVLRGVLYMIIWNAVTLHIPTTVLTFGSSSPLWPQFLPAFDVMEKLQMTIFSLQEIIISGIYLRAAFSLLKPVYRRRTRSVMAQLIWINSFIVVMDVSMLVMEYLNNYAVEATLKSMIYAIKLVLEFTVLNQLMHLATSREDRDLEVTVHEREDGVIEVRTSRNRKVSFPKLWKKNSTGGEASTGCPSSNEYSLRIVPSASTMLNNPAAFVPERRRVQDPFSIEDIQPHPDPRVEHSTTVTVRPASHSSACLDVPYPGSSGTEPEVHCYEQKHEHRLSRLSTIMPSVMSRHTSIRHASYNEAERAPDPALLRSRRVSVTDLFTDPVRAWGSGDDEQARNIEDVEKELGDSAARRQRLAEESKKQSQLER